MIYFREMLGIRSMVSPRYYSRSLKHVSSNKEFSLMRVPSREAPGELLTNRSWHMYGYVPFSKINKYATKRIFCEKEQYLHLVPNHEFKGLEI